MKEKVTAIIVSTKEALQAALKHELCNIYLDYRLYHALLPKDLEALQLHGYVPADTQYRLGVMFWHVSGNNIFDPARHEINDPCGIL